jgi:hypothetical protein
VRHAIDLDDQFSIKRYEIDNVPINRMLATKFPVRQLSITERLPKLCFGTRL